VVIENLLVYAEILWPAWIAGLLVLATHVPMGREVLQRGIIFLDLAIAQIAAFGVVAANTISFSAYDAYAHSHAHAHHGHPADAQTHVPQTLIALTAAIIGSLCLYRLRNLEVRIQEAIIGILFILAATGSLLLLSTDPHGGEKLKEILVGQLLWLQPADLLMLFLAYVVVLLLWWLLRQPLGEWMFYPLFAITITLSTQVVGVYLVFASLIVPALATLNQSSSLAKAFSLGALGYLTGLILSAWFDLPAGATIVWCLVLIALSYQAIVKSCQWLN